MTSDELAARFKLEFNTQPKIFRAPGRVNLIGEHTDYNDGFVLPSAIDFYTHVAVSAREDHQLALRSAEFPESFNFDSRSLPRKKTGAWCDYILGVANELTLAGCKLAGANMLISGDIPIGAGLSSSAALEVAATLALLSLQEKQLPLSEIAKLCQRAENVFVGAHVGIMDPFVSCHGKRDHAVLLDCRSLDFELVPVPESVRFVICNTMVKHELSAGEYNSRRAQCEEGVRLLSAIDPRIKALRDVSEEQLQAQSNSLPVIVYRRCLHVVRENQRVRETVRCLRSDDLVGAGKFMRESHASLRDLYEVSCRELDLMVEAAEGLPGYIGGRMTGGGFGGCTVNLVEEPRAAVFAQSIAQSYREKSGIVPDVHVCVLSDGAGAV